MFSIALVISWSLTRTHFTFVLTKMAVSDSTQMAEVPFRQEVVVIIIVFL